MIYITLVVLNQKIDNLLIFVKFWGKYIFFKNKFQVFSISGLQYLPCGANFRFSLHGVWDELSEQKTGQKRVIIVAQVGNFCLSKQPIRSVYRISLENFPVDPIYNFSGGLRKTRCHPGFLLVGCFFVVGILALFMKETSNFCGIMSLTLKLINTQYPK